MPRRRLDLLAWRHATVGRWKGRKRRSPFYIDWYEGAQRFRISYPGSEIALRAGAAKEAQLNSWVRRAEVKTWTELIAEYGLHQAGARHSIDYRPLLEAWRPRGWLMLGSKDRLQHPQEVDGERLGLYTVLREAIEQVDPTPADPPMLLPPAPTEVFPSPH